MCVPASIFNGHQYSVTSSTSTTSMSTSASSALLTSTQVSLIHSYIIPFTTFLGSKGNATHRQGHPSYRHPCSSMMDLPAWDETSRPHPFSINQAGTLPDPLLQFSTTGIFFSGTSVSQLTQLFAFFVPELDFLGQFLYYYSWLCMIFFC